MSPKFMQIEKIIHLMQKDDSVDAPESAIEWSKNIFRARLAEKPKTLIERIVAVLQSEVARDTPVQGVRSAQTQKARQLLYRAGDVAIDVRVTDLVDRVDIDGQILGEDTEYAAVKLYNEEQAVHTTADDLGSFHFRSVKPGRFSVSLMTGGKELVIEEIDLH